MTIPEDIRLKLLAVIRRIENAAAFDGIGNDDFNTATSVKMLSKIAGMSERSLRDYFKKYTGNSIVKYTSRRRAEYAARIFSLFPTTSKYEVARILGFNCPNGIYGLMRNNGIDNIDSLRDIKPVISEMLTFRIEFLEDYVLFYRQEDVNYKYCSQITFEEENWNVVEQYVASRIPDAMLVGYVGFAIDRYIMQDNESGVFLSGILYSNIAVANLKPDMTGDIGWQLIRARKYAVFKHHGSYNCLHSFYQKIISTIHKTDKIQVDISIPFMEKYINSPTDTPEEELITELWIPLRDR